MSILNNAVLSIQVGVEDYQSKDERRKYSAVRNIYSGLLLLYKEKLRQLSPDDDKDLLIKKNIKPVPNEDGTISLSCVGKSTVNTQQIEDRFKDFGVKVNWKYFSRIKDLRNDLEHYYTNETPETILEILAKSCVLIQEFVTGELGQEPSEMLGEECWQALLSIEDVYESFKNECMFSLEKLVWPYEIIRKSLADLECPKCNSQLVKFSGPESEYPNIDLICHSCEKTFQYQDVITDHLSKIYFADAYIAATQGGEFPIEECIECEFATFVTEENLCIHCGFHYKSVRCAQCGCDIWSVRDDASEPKICDHCNYIESMMAKD